MYQGFREQRKEKLERMAAVGYVVILIWISFMGGQVYQSVRDPQKQWCMNAVGKIQGNIDQIKETHGMILPVKVKK